MSRSGGGSWPLLARKESDGHCSRTISQELCHWKGVDGSTFRFGGFRCDDHFWRMLLPFTMIPNPSEIKSPAFNLACSDCQLSERDPYVCATDASLLLSVLKHPAVTFSGMTVRHMGDMLLKQPPVAFRHSEPLRPALCFCCIKMILEPKIPNSDGRQQRLLPRTHQAATSHSRCFTPLYILPAWRSKQQRCTKGLSHL